MAPIFVSSSSVDDQDLYALPNLPVSVGSIVGIQTGIRAQLDLAGVRTVSKVLRSAGADYDGEEKALTDTWADYLEIDEVDPATGEAWTISAINALQAGMKVKS